jgi:putative ABC transport system substrate-binding protein
MRTVAVLFNPDNPVVQDEVHRTQAAGRVRQVHVRPFEVRTSTDLEIAFSGIARERPQGLIVVPDPLTLVSRRQIVEFARSSVLPAIYGAVEFAQVGGLISYGTDFVAHFRRAAAYVDLILKGRKPNDLPVEQPTTFQLVVNLKTAKALGLTIPPSLLARADAIIQ